MRIKKEIEFSLLESNNENKEADFKNADTIVFDSNITNEEAFALQKLKQKSGISLFNEDAYNYQQFISGYSCITENKLCSANINILKNSDAVIIIGTMITMKNLPVKFNVQKTNIIFMHPINYNKLENEYTQFIKYEIGSEEGVLALLCFYLILNSSNEHLNHFLDDLDVGHLSGESNVSEEELEQMVCKIKTKQKRTLVVGSDLFTHKRSKQIGKLVGFIDEYTNFNVLIVPSQKNTLGVSLICNLNNDCGSKIIHYNTKDSFLLKGLVSNKNLNDSRLIEQQKTFVNIDKRVVNVNNIRSDTSELCVIDGFEKIDFLNLPDMNNYKDDNKCNNLLSDIIVDKNINIENIENMESYHGLVIYECEFLDDLNIQCNNDKSTLIGSKSFARLSKISSGDIVDVIYNGISQKAIFQVKELLQGVIALFYKRNIALINNHFSNGYSYKKVKIQKVNNE